MEITTVKQQIANRFWRLKKEGWDKEAEVWRWMYSMLHNEDIEKERLERLLKLY